MEKSAFEFTGNDFGTADHSRNWRTTLHKMCYDLVFHGIFCVYLLWNSGTLLWNNFIKINHNKIYKFQQFHVKKYKFYIKKLQNLSKDATIREYELYAII